GAKEVPAQVPDPDTAPAVVDPDSDAWAAITSSRRPERPGVRDLLRTAANTVLPLNGTGEGEKDPGLLLALAKFGSAPCIVLGQDRFRQDSRAPLGPAALREARRGMRLAAELHLPLVTVIDTPGAALSQSPKGAGTAAKVAGTMANRAILDPPPASSSLAEGPGGGPWALSQTAVEGGIAGGIARSLAGLANLDAPSVSLILGEGSGGGALALIPTDRVLSAEHGWLSPLPPAGASAIVHRTTERAPEMAQSQGVHAPMRSEEHTSELQSRFEL